MKDIDKVKDNYLKITTMLENKNFIRLFQHFIFHSIVLTILVYIAFCGKESGNVILFGTFLYFPYVLLLSGFNLLFIGLGLKKITKRPFVFLTAIFTNIVFAIWFFLNEGQITIRYWELTFPEFVILNIVFLMLNILTVSLLTSKKHKTT